MDVLARLTAAVAGFVVRDPRASLPIGSLFGWTRPGDYLPPIVEVAVSRALPLPSRPVEALAEVAGWLARFGAETLTELTAAAPVEVVARVDVVQRYAAGLNCLFAEDREARDELARISLGGRLRPSRVAPPEPSAAPILDPGSVADERMAAPLAIMEAEPVREIVVVIPAEIAKAVQAKRVAKAKATRSAEAKRQQLAAVLLANPEWSDRRVARETGTSPSTVGAWRSRMATAGRRAAS